MKRRSLKKILSIIISVVLVLFIGLSYVLGRLVYKGSVGSSQKIKNEDVVEVFSKEEDKPLYELEKYKHEKFMIPSSNGYDVETMFIKSNIETNKTIIIVHGIETYYFKWLKTAFGYLENGYNVVIYNQRHTGNTGGKDFTFGLYERYDLDAAVNFVKNKFPKGMIGVHGYSMGAATATMHTELNEKKKKVDFYILDSPYSEMADAVRLGIEAENIPLIPTSYIASCGNLYTKIFSGFTYDEIKPYEAVKNISVPVMLIHGTADTVCAPNNSTKIYETIPHNKKELWFIEGSKHVKGVDDVKKEYFKRIFNFINKNVEI
ncbi:alpha/beta hydrolase [Clostridium tarantellae]|nr:alpha/beta hydrolase [Clostridium tarantellae]